MSFYYNSGRRSKHCSRELKRGSNAYSSEKHYSIDSIFRSNTEGFTCALTTPLYHCHKKKTTAHQLPPKQIKMQRYRPRDATSYSDHRTWLRHDCCAYSGHQPARERNGKLSRCLLRQRREQSIHEICSNVETKLVRRAREHSEFTFCIPAWHIVFFTMQR